MILQGRIHLLERLKLSLEEGSLICVFLDDSLFLRCDYLDFFSLRFDQSLCFGKSLEETNVLTLFGFQFAFQSKNSFLCLIDGEYVISLKHCTWNSFC